MAYTSLMGSNYSARLLFNLYNYNLWNLVVNTQYTGDAANAASVRINSISPVTIGDYDASTGIGTPQDITSVSQDLLIDQHKFFNFKVEDIVKLQSNIGEIDAVMADTALQLSDVMDKFIANKYTELTATNATGSLAIDSANKAYDTIIDIDTTLSEAKVPLANRFIVMPEFVKGMLSKDTRYVWKTDVMTSGIQQYVHLGNSDVYFSNNVAKVGADYKVIGGDKRAIAFVAALRNMESFRPELFFADAVKGQMVYGGKVIKPQALILTNITK